MPRNVVSETYLHCVVSETSLRNWPTNKYADAHLGRVDNINSVMRAFAVDGRSTAQIGGTPSKLFRNEFKSCAILGSNGLFGRIDIPTYKSRRCYMKRAGLTDSSLVEELWYAQRWKGEWAANGILLDEVQCVVSSMLDNITAISEVPQSTLVVLLTPDGDRL